MEKKMEQGKNIIKNLKQSLKEYIKMIEDGMEQVMILIIKLSMN